MEIENDGFQKESPFPADFQVKQLQTSGGIDTCDQVSCSKYLKIHLFISLFLPLFTSSPHSTWVSPEKKPLWIWVLHFYEIFGGPGFPKHPPSRSPEEDSSGGIRGQQLSTGWQILFLNHRSGSIDHFFYLCIYVSYLLCIY